MAPVGRPRLPCEVAIGQVGSAAQLVVSLAPTVRPQRVLGHLYRALHAAIQEQGHGEVLFAPVDVRLSRTDVVQPDLLVVLHRHAARVNTKFVDGAPSLAVEVVSPGTGRRDRGLEKARYALHGIGECWAQSLANPRAARGYA